MLKPMSHTEGGPFHGDKLWASKVRHPDDMEALERLVRNHRGTRGELHGWRITPAFPDYHLFSRPVAPIYPTYFATFGTVALSAAGVFEAPVLPAEPAEA
jgi:hypothetical protein